MVDFIARLHPVLVHLPIGVLLLACFFQLLSRSQRFASLRPAVPLSLFLGMISAVASCISGFLLSQSGDYDAQLVSRHQWLGIAVAVVSFAGWRLSRSKVQHPVVSSVSIGLILLITFTGHLGGTLTHGSGYLVAGSGKASAKGPAIKPIPDIQSAKLYDDMIQPLLEARCYSCHGPSKQKGKLRLDDPSALINGGESGKAVVPGKPGESEMIARLLLPPDNKDHMPPKEKPQLTHQEQALLHWWISTGAQFTGQVKDFEQPEKMKSVLAAFSGAVTDMENISGLPEKEAPRADPVVLEKLRAAGVIVMPVTQNSNYLSANFITATSTADSVLSLLAALKDQVLWLKMDIAPINDAALKHVAACTTLARLSLAHTQVTDEGIGLLQSLSRLQSLNLTHTSISADGVSKLKSLKNLKHIYVYRSAVDSQGAMDLQNSFPGVIIERGNYQVPTLASDTTLVPYPKS